MNFITLIEKVSNKKNFTSLSDYIDFACLYLEQAASSFQAVIICQNERKYQFWQYKEDGNFNITRPINTELMYSYNQQENLRRDFIDILNNLKNISEEEVDKRQILCNSIYTLQQCIGAALDGLPAGKSNTARKINGDLFERLICLIITHLGINCESGVAKVPIIVDGVKEFKMNYQHDLIIKANNEIKIIGSVKTSSKDRLDKIFIDKFLFTKLTEVDIPHIAIFLNDVQRGKKTDRTYKVSSTFLPGHFKGYTIKLNPLDGVYYCDIRPNMNSDKFLKQHIKTIDHLLCFDLWKLLGISQGVEAEIEENQDK